MEAPEDEDKEGSGSVVRGAGPPSSPGGSSEGPGDTGSVAGESAAAEGTPQGEEVSVDSGQAAQAAASDRPMESQRLVFTMTAAFQSYLDVEVARRVLSQDAEPYRGTVHWELTVTGNWLTVRLIAQDSDLLQNATASLMNRLYMMFQIIQHLESPPITTFQCSKGV